MTPMLDRNRRRLLTTAAAGGLLGAGNLLSIGASAAGKTKIDMQLGWLIGGNQIGEVVAKKLGYYEQEGIEFGSSPAGRTSTASPSSPPAASRSARCRRARR